MLQENDQILYFAKNNYVTLRYESTPYVRQTTARENELRDNYAACWRSVTPLTSMEALLHGAVRTPIYAMSSQNITRV